MNKYNNIYHRANKMKPADVKTNTHINFAKKSNNKDHKFQVGDHVRISKYKNMFAKEVFVIKKINNTIPWTYVISDLMAKKLLKNCMKKNCKKTNQE